MARKVQIPCTGELKKLLSIFSQGCRVKTQYGSYITVVVLGFVAVVVGTKRLKKSTYEIANTPVSPSVRFSVTFCFRKSGNIYQWQN